jgi:hypothetical protein
MAVAIICAGLLGVLLFGLGFAVSLQRGRSNAVIGYSSDPIDPLHKLVRAHGNTAEYAPMLAILILVAGQLEPAVWVLWLMGVATLGRYLIAVGLMMGSLEKANPLRFLGAFLTYVCGIVLAGNAIFSA